MPEPRRTDNGSQSGAEGGRVATAVSILRARRPARAARRPTARWASTIVRSAAQNSALILPHSRRGAADRFLRPQFFADCYDTNCAGEKIKISPRVRSKNVAIARADLLNRSRRPTASVWRIKKHTIGGQACKIHRATFLRSARSHQFSLLTRPTGRACRVGPRAALLCVVRFAARKLDRRLPSCGRARSARRLGRSLFRVPAEDRSGAAAPTRERASCPFTAE